MCIIVVPSAIAMACLVGYTAYRVFRDALRFGREHLAFPFILGVAVLFAAAGFILAGPWGVVPGGLFLLTYLLGWWRGQKHAKQVP